MSGFTTLVGLASTLFHAPSFAIFTDLLIGWVCAPGRRTITAMIAVADPLGRRAHDAYHRFVRDGVWSMSGLWRILATHAVARFAPTGVVECACDDTLFRKSGAQVEGAGIFRDAVRSTKRRVVFALGLNLVVVTLRVKPPWGGCPIAVPVNARLHRKGDTTTTVEHAEAMLRELAEWLPGRELHLCADGAHASLAGAKLPRTHITSRMRRDAAIYQPAPPPTGKHGRPRTKGDRLPTPEEMAHQVRKRDWRKTTIDVRGREAQRLIHVRDVLWYTVKPKGLVRLVIVRDPDGVEPDDFFFTTDLTNTGAEVASRYAGRWSIEPGVGPTCQQRGQPRVALGLHAGQRVAVAGHRRAHRGHLGRVEHHRAVATTLGVAEHCALVQRLPARAPAVRLTAPASLHDHGPADHPRDVTRTCSSHHQHPPICTRHACR